MSGGGDGDGTKPSAKAKGEGDPSLGVARPEMIMSRPTPIPTMITKFAVPKRRTACPSTEFLCFFCGLLLLTRLWFSRSTSAVASASTTRLGFERFFLVPAAAFLLPAVFALSGASGIGQASR